jgi:hypothetical protein
MKNIWLFILMIGGVTQLRAQQLTQPIAPGKTPDNSIYQYFKAKPDNNLFKIAPVSPYAGQSSIVIPTIKEVMVVETAYNMPIVKLHSDDKMPIARPWNPNTHYTMLIQDYGKAKADSANRSIIRP